MRAWLATDTHRSRSPDNLRLTGFCRRSNPHRSATLLIGISTFPRFPPWRLVQHLPPSLTELGYLNAHRQVSDNVGHPLTTGAGRERPLRRRLLRCRHLQIHGLGKAVRERHTGSSAVSPCHEQLHHRVPTVAPCSGVIPEFIRLDPK